jgi:hypothetical protein
LWKEAEKLVGSIAQVLDPLYVIETVMRFFYFEPRRGRTLAASCLRWIPIFAPLAAEVFAG